jgi:hypothetical protein
VVGRPRGKNKAAQALVTLRNKKLSAEERSAIARLGGLAKANSLPNDAVSRARRSAIARKAAEARWAKQKAVEGR